MGINMGLIVENGGGKMGETKKKTEEGQAESCN